MLLPNLSNLPALLISQASERQRLTVYCMIFFSTDFHAFPLEAVVIFAFFFFFLNGKAVSLVPGDSLKAQLHREFS